MNRIKDEEISFKKIDDFLESFLNSKVVDTSLDNLIMNTISLQSESSFSRKKIQEKILNSEYITEIEFELLEKICNELEIKQDKEKLKIQTKPPKNEKNKKIKAKNSSNCAKNKIENEISFLSNLESVNFDSANLLKILTEEFLIQNDMLKLENYIGDFSNFDCDLLIENKRIFLILNKIRDFLHRYTSTSKNSYLALNVINFFHIVLKIPNSKILVQSTQIFLDYFKIIIEKFFKGPFDIEKFSDLSINAQCLTNILTKFYEGKDILLSRIENGKIFSIIETLFECVLSNYDDKNPIYFKENEKETQFGLSTNYIMIILFCLDSSLSVFKILFRNSQMRRHLIDKFAIYRHLPFLDQNTCRKSFKVKFCFLWNHVSVLNQIFPNKKIINKKILVYSLVSIKMHFLGIVLRYKSLRAKFYEELNSYLNSGDELRAPSDKFNCFSHFKNVMCFMIDILFRDVPDELNDYEDWQRENLFYLIKEVLCDFVLYCTDKTCIWSKKKFLEDLDEVEEYKSEQNFQFLLDDLLLAFNENVNG